MRVLKHEDSTHLMTRCLLIVVYSHNTCIVQPDVAQTHFLVEISPWPSSAYNEVACQRAYDFVQHAIKVCPICQAGCNRVWKVSFHTVCPEPGCKLGLLEFRHAFAPIMSMSNFRPRRFFATGMARTSLDLATGHTCLHDYQHSHSANCQYHSIFRHRPRLSFVCDCAYRQRTCP